MKQRIISVASAGLVMSLSIFAQVKGGGAVNPTVPSPVTGVGTSRPTTPSTQTQSPIPTMERPIYISGRVTLDDGTPPPESVRIQLTCTANPRSVGYTDTKGRFNVDLGNRRNSSMYSDASESGFPSGQPRNMTQTGSMQSSGMAERNLTGCDIRAALPGFRSDVIRLDNRRSLDNPEVGTIILHRLGNVEGLTISATSAMAPKDARKAYEKGMSEAKKDKWDSAERDFTKAVDAYPKYASAWYELGHAQQEQQNFDAARKSYAQAVAADSKLVTPYQELAVLAAKENKWEEVAAQTDKVLKLNPVDFPQDWFLNALAKYRLQQLDGAEKSAREGLKLEGASHFPKLHEILAAVLADRGNLAGAAEELTAYLKVNPQAADAETVKKQIADLQKGTVSQVEKNKAPQN